MLKTWYNDLSICMIESQLENTYSEIFDFCRNLTQSKSDQAFVPINEHKSQTPCCTEELAVSQRGFDWSLRGQENGLVQPIIELLQFLSERNMSLLFLGDSMNEMLYASFLQEIKREDPNQKDGELLFNAKELVPWFQTPESFGLNSTTLTYFSSLTIWKPNALNELFPVYLYEITLTSLMKDDLLVRERLLPQIMLQDHLDGIVLFANVGLHLPLERTLTSRIHLNHRVHTFLNWLHEISLHNLKNLIFFRETTPAHFNSPTLDGSNERWRQSNHYTLAWQKPNDWDHTLYSCREIENPQDENQQPPENIFVSKALKIWGPSSRLHYLPVFEYLAPFYRLKFGNCAEKVGRGPGLDCVHYCAWSPPMWVPVWKEMLLRVQSILSHLPPFISSFSHHVNSPSSSSSSSSSSPFSLITIPFHSPIRLSECIFITEEHTTTTTSHPSPPLPPSPPIPPSNPIYLLHHGLRRKIIDIDNESKLQSLFSLELEGKKERGTEKERKREEEREMQIVEEEEEGENRRKGEVNGSFVKREEEGVFVMTLSRESIQNIPEGYPLNPFDLLSLLQSQQLSSSDSISTSSHSTSTPSTPTPSYPDGTVVKLAGNHHPTTYYILGGERHAIPSFGTFLMLNLELSQVIELNEKDLNQLPEGESLPYIENF